MQELKNYAQKLLEEAKAVAEAAKHQSHEQRKALHVSPPPQRNHPGNIPSEISVNFFSAVHQLHDRAEEVRDKGLPIAERPAESGQYTIQELQEAIDKVEKLLNELP